MTDDCGFIFAWDSDIKFRRVFVAELTRELSKTGSLEAFAESLAQFSGHLPTAEILILYSALQQSKRPESEWKSEFLGIFSEVRESDLPEPIVVEVDAQSMADLARQQSEFGRPESGYPEIPF
jgi:hypothetical protein